MIGKTVICTSAGMMGEAAGSCMRPPPPAMESMSPAMRAKNLSVAVSVNQPRNETKTPSVPDGDIRRVSSG